MQPPRPRTPIADRSPAFQEFVERRLTRLWHQNDPREECRTAALMIVKKWRSDGRWRTPTRLGTQEVHGCRVLHRFDVPAAIVPDGKCHDGDEVVSYRR